MKAHCHQNIVNSITSLIKSGDINPGDRLPAERQLAQRYGVSRNTIREAIKVLSENGVVISRRGAGTFVTDSELGDIFNYPLRNIARLKEIFELRKILEPQIAALAASRITADQLNELDNLVARQQSATQAVDQALLDEEFHRLIAVAAGNSLLCDLYDKLHELVSESRNEELQSEARSTLSIAHHKAIARALREGKPETASDLMHNHMDEVERKLLLP